MSSLPEIDHSREIAVRFFLDYVKKNGNELRTKSVCDLSAGRGFIARLFEEVGADIFAFDLFPDQNRFLKAIVGEIDLQEKFPINDALMDVVICCETIEHLPNQYFLFQEASRVLKSGGVFILTTPNSSSLRSRFSQFMMESEHYGAPAPNELNAFTSWDDRKGGYFSKIFISGVLRLRTMAALSHLELKNYIPQKEAQPQCYYFFGFRCFIISTGRP